MSQFLGGVCEPFFIICYGLFFEAEAMQPRTQSIRDRGRFLPSFVSCFDVALSSSVAVSSITRGYLALRMLIACTHTRVYVADDHPQRQCQHQVVPLHSGSVHVCHAWNLQANFTKRLHFTLTSLRTFTHTHKHTRIHTYTHIYTHSHTSTHIPWHTHSEAFSYPCPATRALLYTEKSRRIGIRRIWKSQYQLQVSKYLCDRMGNAKCQIYVYLSYIDPQARVLNYCF